MQRTSPSTSKPAPWRERDRARLGRLVGGAGAVGVRAGDARDDHDRPARRLERGQERVERVERAVEVGVEHVVPGLGRELVQAALLDVRPGGDDQRVDALERAANAPTASRSVKSSRCAVTPGSEISRRAAAWTVSPAAANARAVASPMPDDAPIDDDRAAHASRPAPARKTLNSGGGGPSASRANCLRPVLERAHRGQVVAERGLPAHQPLVGLLEVGHRVRVGALDAVLAAHDVVEAERRVVVGEADADHRPARAQQLEPERARGLGADRVEHQVGLAGVAASSGERVTAWAPSDERARAPLVLRLDHRDVRDAVQQRGLQRDEADRPRADARPRSRRRAAPAAPRGRRWPAAPSARRRAAEMPSGSTRASAARTFTKSANAPGTCTPISTRSRHRFVCPARHSRHSPQPLKRVDRDPRALQLRRRPRPAATTVPANSWPITSGGVRLPMWPR